MNKRYISIVLGLLISTFGHAQPQAKDSSSSNSYPNTITECHALIEKLENALAQTELRLSEKEEKIKRLTRELSNKNTIISKDETSISKQSQCEEKLARIVAIFDELLKNDNPFYGIHDLRDFEDEVKKTEKITSDAFNEVGAIMIEIRELDCPLSFRITLSQIPLFVTHYNSFLKYRQLRWKNPSMIDTYTKQAEQSLRECTTIRTILDH